MKKYSLYAERTPLIEKLPLDTPMGVHVCPSTFCNFRCYYCKHTLDENKTDKKVGCLDQAFMTMETFKKVVDQLKDFPRKTKLLQFAWLGEPLMNKDLPKMVEYAKKADVAEEVSIVTNASLLTKEKSDALIAAGLDRLRISLQGLTANDYYDVSKYKIDMDKYVENIRYFYEHKKHTQVYIKIMDVMLKNEKDEKLFHEIYDDICDVLNIEHLVPLHKELDISAQKEDFNVGYYGNSVVDNHMCHYVFINFMISPLGGVFPCATAEQVDCDGKTKTMELANIYDRSLYEIWNSTERKQLIKNMIYGEKDVNPICRDCTYTKYHIATEDRLDLYANRLKEMYNV